LQSHSPRSIWPGLSNRTQGGLHHTRSLWAFGEPQKSIRLIAICFSLQILFAGRADGYNNSNRSAMSLNKKRQLAALDFANELGGKNFIVKGWDGNFLLFAGPADKAR
jgi:hypothetical protein